jgi:nucleoid-associated protein
MTVNKLIIHNLKKEVQGPASLTVSKDVLVSSEKKTIALTDELNSRYRNNITYGVFNENDNDAETFKKEFDKYLSTPTKDEFVKFSCKTVNFLYNKIDSIKQARGGYLVYVDYIDDRSNRFFSVFLIRDKTDKRFKNRNGVFNIDEVICVETDKLAMACRINIKNYLAHSPTDAGTYLGFVSIKQSDASNYFLDWIGAVRVERNAEDTRSLIKILNGVDLPEEDGETMSRDEFRKKAYDAICSFGKSPININTLSSILFDDESIIGKYAEDNDIIITSEFVPDKKTARKLVSYHVTADKIELKFPSEYYGDKISIDKDDPTLVLIRSDKFAREIALQVEE